MPDNIINGSPYFTRHGSKRRSRHSATLSRQHEYPHIFMDAIVTGNFRVAKRILDSGCNANIRDFHNQTGLMRAVYLNDEQQRKNMIKLLIRKGASLKLQDSEGKTALIHAVLSGFCDALELLLPHSRLIQEDFSGNNVLTHSAMKGDLEITTKLVASFKENGLDVDKRNLKGLTPLLITCQLGHIDCARVLVCEGNASPRIRDLDRFQDAEKWAALKVTNHASIEFLSSKAQKRHKMGSLQQQKGPKLLSDYLIGGLLGPRPSIFDGVSKKTRKEEQIPKMSLNTQEKSPLNIRHIPMMKSKSVPEVYDPVPFDPKLYLESSRRSTQLKGVKRETYSPKVVKRSLLKSRPKQEQLIEISEEDEIIC